MAQTTQQNQAAQQTTPQTTEVDPISKFQMLVTHLKDSLSNLIKVAAQAFYNNSQVDGCLKSSESVQQRLDKSLEDFYSICDQIELNLRLAIECNNQTSDSNRMTPIPVQGRLGKPDPPNNPTGQPENQPYSQYLSTVKAQVNAAREIHDVLVECSRKISERNIPPQPSQPPPSQPTQ